MKRKLSAGVSALLLLTSGVAAAGPEAEAPPAEQPGAPRTSVASRALSAPPKVRSLYAGAVAAGGLGLSFGAIGLANILSARGAGARGELVEGRIAFDTGVRMGHVADAMLGVALVSGAAGYLLSRRAPKTIEKIEVSLSPLGVGIGLEY